MSPVMIQGSWGNRGEEVGVQETLTAGHLLACGDRRHMRQRTGCGLGQEDSAGLEPEAISQIR